MVKTMKLIGISFLITLAVISCKHNEGDYHGIHERITKESENFKGTTISSDAYINEIKTIEITEGDHTFLIPERKSQIKSYACSDCHTVSLSELKDRQNNKK
ncbi:MAG: hypothetical protein P8P29_09425, partial [Flavobacteriaceae bacterium]|nr:hypothetical protein [Flavobacteriaceae bacterium]